VFFETLGQSLLPEVNHFAAETPREIEPVRGEVGDHDDDLISFRSIDVTTPPPPPPTRGIL
jgi:hypothetical protein